MPGIIRDQLLNGRLVVAVLLLTGSAAPAAAQEAGDRWQGAVPTVPGALRTPPAAFAASLAVPGSGQAALGLRRWPLYLALEAGLWWLWLDARGDLRSHRGGYRDLAWDVARIQEGSRMDAGWPYYEAMSHYGTSGAYDRDPAPGVQPEENPATYNGSVWEIARGLYLPGGAAGPGTPEYERALAWYDERAAGPGFLWSWVGHAEELNRFRDLIGAADDARRSQSTAAGVILANHLISAIDALVAARLKAAAAGADLGSTVLPGPSGPILRVELRIPLTN